MNTSIFRRTLSLYYVALGLLCLLDRCKSVQRLLPEDANYVNDLFANVTLRKCNCEKNEIYVNDTCVESPDRTIVPVTIFHDYPELFFVNTSQFQVKANSNLGCSSGKHLTSILLRDFSILQTQELYHASSNITFSPINYCLNHINGKFDSLEWEIRLCLTAPEIPICCDADEFAKFSPRCRNPRPPIMYGISPLKDPFIKKKQIGQLQCEMNQIKYRLPLSSFDDVQPTVFIANHLEEPSLIISTGSEPKTFNSEEYCIAPTEEGQYEAIYCLLDPLQEHETACENFTCVRKCCPFGQNYFESIRSCQFVNASDLWTPLTRNGSNETEQSVFDNLKLVYGFPLCSVYYSIDQTAVYDSYILNNDGTLYFPKHGQVTLPATKYCMDNIISEKTGEISEQVFRCFPESPREKGTCQRVQEIMFPILQIISCIFLLITLIVYATIPELHAKLHGKSLISHVSALFVAYFSLSVTTLNAGSVSMSVCRSLAFIIQFSFLSAFFWLNVMCFDIWWTLRSMRPVAETSESFRRRFFLYSLYAWGCPLIIVIVTCVMDMLLKHEHPNLILPGFGYRSCWFQDNYAIWFYFYSFIALVTVVDVFFFICVALILIQAQRANNNILRTTSKQHKERVWIYLKLFVVMGITWICEIVSWQEGSCEYWFVTDIVNSLQGFFIFLIFICKSNIFAKMQTRGTASTRKLKRMVTGSSSYGSSSQVSQQTSLDSSRKLSTSLHYQLSKLNKENNNIDEIPKKGHL